MLSRIYCRCQKFPIGKPNPQVHLNYLIDKVLISITDFGIGIERKNLIVHQGSKLPNSRYRLGQSLVKNLDLASRQDLVSSVPSKTVFYIELNL